MADATPLMAGMMRCLCDRRYRARKVEYTAPPPGETAMPLRGKTYWRSYDECSACGHYFAVHDLDLTALYEGGYVDATYKSPNGLFETFSRIRALPPEKSDNHWRVKRVDAYARRHIASRSKVSGTPSLLDIGAGLSIFPAGMKDAGWDCTALDPDPRTIQHARETVGVKAVCGDFLKITPSEMGQYDLVTFNKVLEHVADPIKMLAKAAQHLAPDGLVYIEIPDAAAAHDASGYNREEFSIDHLHVFSPASAAVMAQRAGYSILSLERFREPSSKYTLAVFAAKTA